ncbi:MAG TPA: hypothetical protein VME45_06395 [Stellaceae bacterium]|nr:hypothetical protein [Stellaceae bacterium]
MRLVMLLAALAVLLLPLEAVAYTAYGQQMMNKWAASDKCAAVALKKFPDHTPEDNARRDQEMQQCLSNGLLPPRSDLQH